MLCNQPKAERPCPGPYRVSMQKNQIRTNDVTPTETQSPQLIPTAREPDASGLVVEVFEDMVGKIDA